VGFGARLFLPDKPRKAVSVLGEEETGNCLRSNSMIRATEVRWPEYTFIEAHEKRANPDR
jgi:hypothetical protein